MIYVLQKLYMSTAGLKQCNLRNSSCYRVFSSFHGQPTLFINLYILEV
jgi:hypothetical protein